MITTLVKNIHILFFLLSLLLIPLDESVIASDSSALSRLLSQEEKIWLENHPGLKIGGPRSFPPFSFFDEDGVAQGISYEYLDLIMGHLGVKLEVEQSLPWAEVLTKAKAKEIDIISCIAKSPDREEYLLFSDPYLSFPLVIITKKESKFIGGLGDLRGFKVAMVKKNIVYELVNRDKIELVYHFVDSTIDALRAVSVGDADAYIDNLASATYLIEKYGLTNLKVAAPTAYENYNLHFAVRLDYPELASIINKGLSVLTQDQHAEIRNKWLSIRYEYGISKVDVIKWVLMVICFSLILLSLIIVWNRRLKREITERKEAEQLLLESEARFKALHNASFGGIAIHDKGIILDCNKGLSEMTGYSVTELIGMDGLLLIAEESRPVVMKNILSGYEKSYEANGLRKNGEKIPMRLEARNIPYKGKNVRVVEFRDITEVKLAEEEQKKLQAQLSHAQKMESVGRLAGGVAHDFNNMLGVILGHTEMLLYQISPDQPFYADLQKIQIAGERSANLVRQLLAFARKQTVALKVLDLNSTVESMLTMLRRLISEDIGLTWVPGKKLWSVKIDPSQIDQILANLCVNAGDAITGVGNLTIETENITFDEYYCSHHKGVLPGDYLLLAVSDTGCGMDKETLSNIFEPFFTTKEMGKGTGLGLATVYGIVKQNNGFINVYSEPDQGTTFRIYLPRYMGISEHNQQEEKTEYTTHGNETILLVEDEPSLLEMTTMMLQSLGYNVLAASNPGESIYLAQEHKGKIDMLMTDVIMPEMNGQDLAKQLFSLSSILKCLFMSGYTANVITHHGVLDEGLNFIQKPFSVNQLANKIREVLDK